MILKSYKRKAHISELISLIMAQHLKINLDTQKQEPEASYRPQLATLLKKGLRNRCFPVNFAKFLRAPFLQNNVV